MPRRLAVLGCSAWLGLGAMTPLAAQPLPSAPISLAGGRVVLGGELSASVGPTDHPGYFNYTDYDRTALRLTRLDLTAAWTPRPRWAVLADLRTENFERPVLQALYLRLRPWTGRAIDVQLGRIPPAFGAYSRRVYGTDQLLISYPLAYQYLTTLRADALPMHADELLRQRGRGWRVAYSLGNRAAAGGVPLVSAFRWDTGVQVRVGTGPVELAMALTQGTLSRPRVTDDNDGHQVSGRLAVRPAPGLTLGLSAARGQFLARDLLRALPPDAGHRDTDQRAVGLDAEYSAGRWLVRSEVVLSRWALPPVQAPVLADPLRAVGVWGEGRYRFSPRLSVGGRLDHLGFSRIAGTLFAGRPTSWDAPVTRASAVVGVTLLRNIVVRAEYQYNWRDGGRPRERGLAAMQAIYWF